MPKLKRAAVARRLLAGVRRLQGRCRRHVTLTRGRHRHDRDRHHPRRGGRRPGGDNGRTLETAFPLDDLAPRAGRCRPGQRRRRRRATLRLHARVLRRARSSTSASPSWSDRRSCMRDPRLTRRAGAAARRTTSSRWTADLRNRAPGIQQDPELVAALQASGSRRRHARRSSSQSGAPGLPDGAVTLEVPGGTRRRPCRWWPASPETGHGRAARSSSPAASRGSLIAGHPRVPRRPALSVGEHRRPPGTGPPRPSVRQPVSAPR